MAVTVTRLSPDDPSSPVRIDHPSGSSVTVHPFGATVTSFRTASGREVLFVSSDAKLDGSKAIRGGVPLVFPRFGQPSKDMPQHGFLRNNAWTIVEDDDDDAETSDLRLALALKDARNARGTGAWSGDAYDCAALLSISLEAERLTTALTITNTGDEAFDFQTLLHTYYAVDGGAALDPASTHVTGLEGYDAEDKITGETYAQTADPIIVDREVDRIYRNKTRPVLDVNVSVGGGARVNLRAKAEVAGAEVPVSVVVWNPFVDKAKAMSDFADEQYHDMICVEPGILHDVPALSGGDRATLEQVITAL